MLFEFKLLSLQIFKNKIALFTLKEIQNLKYTSPSLNYSVGSKIYLQLYQTMKLLCYNAVLAVLQR